MKNCKFRKTVSALPGKETAGGEGLRVTLRRTSQLFATVKANFSTRHVNVKPYVISFQSLSNATLEINHGNRMYFPEGCACSPVPTLPFRSLGSGSRTLPLLAYVNRSGGR